MCTIGPLFPVAQYTLAVSIQNILSFCVQLTRPAETTHHPRSMLHRHRPGVHHLHLPPNAQPHCARLSQQNHPHPRYIAPRYS